MQDFDEDDGYPQRNLFQPSWHERMLAPWIRLLHTILRWVSWPILTVAGLLSAIGGFLLWCLGSVGFQLQRAWYWCAWRTAERLRLEGMQRQIRELQDETTRVMGDLGDSVRAQTTDSPWIRRMREAVSRQVWRLHLGILWVSDLLAAWAERSVLVRTLLLPFRLLIRSIVQLVDFLWGWIWTRQYRRLWMAIPAVVLLLPLAYCAIRLPFYTREARARDYRRAAIEALQQEDYLGAQLLYRKLQQLGDQHERVIFRSALLVAQQGDLEGAYQRLKSIAPVHEMGWPDAHLWIAEAISQGVLEQDNPERLRLLETHLNHVLNFYPGQPDATMMLAGLRRSSGQGDRATTLLDALSPDQLSPAQEAELASRYADLGQTATAREKAREAVARFKQLAAADRTQLSVRDYLHWAMATHLVEDVSATLAVLHDAQASYPDDSSIEQALMVATAGYYDQQVQQLPPARRVVAVKRLLDLDPGSESNLRRMSVLIADSAVGQQALKLLEQQEWTESLPASVCLAVADGCARRSDWEGARTYYERVLQQDEQQHAALNNLAWLLAIPRAVDLPRALTLADQAVSLQPENPHYRETRGQVLLRLKRWADAAKDLEAALNGMPDSPGIHESLAVAYEQLDEPELARIHRQRAGG